MRTCTVPGCRRPVQARGWCAMHYKRWQTMGSVAADRPVQEHHAQPEQCRAPGCERPPIASGLCLMHYRQEHGSRGLSTRMVGEPDGAGQWGILDEDSEGVLCHECGRRLQALGYHLRVVHEMSPDEYRDAHGLARGLPLTTRAVSAARSAQALDRIGTPEWRRLEAARDPRAAARSRESDTWDAVSRTHRQR